MLDFLKGIIIFITTITLPISGLFSPAKQVKPSTIPVTTIVVSIVPTVIKTLPTLIPITQQKIRSSPTAAPTPDPNKRPRGIAPGIYPPDSLTQEQRQWLWAFYKHEGNAPLGYGGETIVPDPNKGPGGIGPGQYPIDFLTQEQKQWLWKFYGHTGDTPVGYRGEEFVPTRAYSGSSKACFTFYGETVSGDTYTPGKPITLDASCSEPEGVVFRWSIEGVPLIYFNNIPSKVDGYSKEVKIVTKCFGCSGPGQYLSDAKEVKIKLEVAGGRVYKPDSIEKIIRFRTQ